MPATYDNGIAATAASVGTLNSGAFTISGANRAVIVVLCSRGSTPTTVTGAGTTITASGAVSENSDRRTRIYEGVAPTTGSQSVTGNWDNADGEVSICAVSTTDTNQTDPADNYTIATGTGTEPTLTVPNVTSDDLVIDGVVGVVDVIGAGQTSRMNVSDAQRASTQLGASGGVMSWSDSFAQGIGWAQAAIRVVTAGLPAAAALTGTVTVSITEADIVAGGKTLILTLTGNTYIVN